MGETIQHGTTTVRFQFMERVNVWGKQPLGLQLDALVYNTFAISVLSFVAQLEIPPNGCWIRNGRLYARQRVVQEIGPPQMIYGD